MRHMLIVGIWLYLCLTGTESRQKRQTNNPCDPNPCYNGGTCTSSGNDYKCTCTNQFRGRDCDSTGKCSAGWEIYGDKCFKFSTSKGDWDSSLRSCENDEDGYLAEIYSEGENRFLEYIGKQVSTLTSGVWIGLRWHSYWDNYYWVHANAFFSYDNRLASCNPSDSVTDCIIFDQSNGKWCQQNCAINSNYICEKNAEDDPCFPNPCQNEGTCSINGNDYTCNCRIGFLGKSCENKPCDPNPCQNGGTCTSSGNDYTCECTNQFRGRDCDSTGQCSAGWEIYGDKCFKFSTRTEDWESAIGSCEFDEDGYLAEIYSEGENRFLEYIGEKSSTQTSRVWIGLRWHNFWDYYVWVNSYVYYTYNNWHANCNMWDFHDDCITFDKSNGKWCQQECTINSNYICEKEAEDDPCFPNPCQNEGTCSVDGNDYTCICQLGFIGKSCENRPCDPNPCQNGGTCTSNGNDYTCTCTNQFRGRDCESTGKCSAGWEIYGEKCFKFSASTRDWDLSKNSCENEENGYLAEIFSEGENRFLEYIGKQISTLTPGVWIGLRWHDFKDTYYWVNSGEVSTYDNRFDSCHSWRSLEDCIFLNQSNGRWCQQKCTINSNYICEKNAEDDPCFPNPCTNEGTCSVYGIYYACNCHVGFYGRNCETQFNPCDPNPCQNGGTCTINGMEYICTCTNQFRGSDCENPEDDPEVDPCSPNPCQNQGTCTVNGNDYTCNCQTSYRGKSCETIETCPGGWSLFNGKCYMYSERQETWSTAKDRCSSQGGNLAQINSYELNEYLFMLKGGNYYSVWIGLSDSKTENTFKWDGTQQTATYTNWNTNEPNNGGGLGEEDCVEMSTNKKWNDYICTAVRGYFCEQSPTLFTFTG